MGPRKYTETVVKRPISGSRANEAVLRFSKALQRPPAEFPPGFAFAFLAYRRCEASSSLASPDSLRKPSHHESWAKTRDFPRDTTPSLCYTKF